MESRELFELEDAIKYQPPVNELPTLSTGHSAYAGRFKHRFEDRLMSNEFRQADLMIGDVWRRWTTERKLQIIEASFAPGETVSSAARRHGVAPNLLHRWRRRLSEGGAVAADSDNPVIGNSEVKKLEDPYAAGR